jgi:hypothetical protein
VDSPNFGVRNDFFRPKWINMDPELGDFSPITPPGQVSLRGRRTLQMKLCDPFALETQVLLDPQVIGNTWVFPHWPVMRDIC